MMSISEHSDAASSALKSLVSGRWRLFDRGALIEFSVILGGCLCGMGTYSREHV